MNKSLFNPINACMFMKSRVYVDTSVIGGYFDKEFSDPTAKLFEEFQNGVKFI